MKSAYRVLAGLISFAVVVQAASIAFALFQISKEIDDGAVVDKSYVESNSGDAGLGFAIHAIDGQMIIPLLAILLLIVSFFAKVRGGTVLALVIFLDVVLQVVLAFVSFAAPAVGFLHGLNALVVFSAAVFAGRRAAEVSAGVGARVTEGAAA